MKSVSQSLSGFSRLSHHEVMKNPIVLAAAFILSLALAAPAQMPMQAAHQATAPAATTPVASKAPTAAVARINGVAVTEAQLDEEMQRLFPYYAVHGGKVPAGAEAEIREKSMHDLVMHELMYQEARHRNLQVPPAEWQKRLHQMRSAFSRASRMRRQRRKSMARSGSSSVSFGAP